MWELGREPRPALLITDGRRKGSSGGPRRLKIQYATRIFRQSLSPRYCKSVNLCLLEDGWTSSWVPFHEEVLEFNASSGHASLDCLTSRRPATYPQMFRPRPSCKPLWMEVWRPFRRAQGDPVLHRCMDFWWKKVYDLRRGSYGWVDWIF